MVVESEFHNDSRYPEERYTPHGHGDVQERLGKKTGHGSASGAQGLARTLGRRRLPLTTRPRIKSKLSLNIRKTE